MHCIMPSQTCVVNNCKSRKGIKHRFPKDPHLFDIWVSKCSKKKLNNLSIMEAYEKYVVYDMHFEPKFKILGTKRLHKEATPSLCIYSLRR
ncbi:52 kDa repressor of the inhibitor of the protein kinase-like [Aphis craccivora]|uniref:52 kDa repressor of the inhibitor of the protein kinase-like n=1 Tax=Aphis craccivora TaxID=307492 RepID=A0A6G0YEE1_APHCR|nr:52 kDa repressor of the inhibitor of the protein kinase-like [Aphis craccivora]